LTACGSFQFQVSVSDVLKLDEATAVRQALDHRPAEHQSSYSKKVPRLSVP